MIYEVKKKGQNPAILLVDDVPENIQVLHEILHGHNYSFILAGNAKETYEAIEKQTPDLIILDIILPEISGFDICKKLKADPVTKDIPIIFLSARTDLEDKLKGFELGAVDYITKPFEEAEVLARVNTHIKLKKSEDKLIELNAIKDKLFSIIAHDLKNPLNAIIGYSGILLDQTEEMTEEERSNSIGVIAKLAQNIDNLLDDLLAWSRIQSTNYDVKIHSIEINKLFESIKEFYTPIANEKSIAIELKVEDNIELYSDENIVRTVMRNLISNAIKFTNTNGRVVIGVSTNNDFVEVFVEDNGVGITEENAEKLFRSDVHYSSNGTNNERGTGMGLALCYDFLQLVDGKIWVESKINEGSKFYFSLPKNIKAGE